MHSEPELATALDKLLNELSAQHKQLKLAHHFLTFKDVEISSQQWLSLQSFVPDSILNSLSKRQSSFFYGRVCAEQVLTELGVPPKLDIGKMRQPIWPNGVKGSISHCHGIALAVATDQWDLHGIGIDIELFLDNRTRDVIKKSALNTSEQEQLNRWMDITGLSENKLVTIIFSIKESFYKAVSNYVHRILEFDAIEIVNITQKNVEFIIQEKSVVDTLIKQGMIQDVSLKGQYIVHEYNAITCVIL